MTEPDTRPPEVDWTALEADAGRDPADTRDEEAPDVTRTALEAARLGAELGRRARQGYGWRR